MFAYPVAVLFVTIAMTGSPRPAFLLRDPDLAAAAVSPPRRYLGNLQGGRSPTKKGPRGRLNLSAELENPTVKLPPAALEERLFREPAHLLTRQEGDGGLPIWIKSAWISGASPAVGRWSRQALPSSESASGSSRHLRLPQQATLLAQV